MSDSNREITVKVEKDSNDDLEDEIQRLTEALEERDEFLQSLAEEEFEKHKRDLASQYPEYKQRILDAETPSQVEWIEAFLSGEPKHKASTGVVKLRSGDYETNPLLKEFQNPKEAIQVLYKHASNPKSKYYSQANQIRQHLKTLYNEKPSLPRKLDLSGVGNPLERMAIKELGSKFTHQQFTEWIKRKAREANVEK